ncbi:MAG: ATP-binding protein [Pseudomonadota bacterium]|nr:ATP-binding protein [Pseudomonadota bacterium]
MIEQFDARIGLPDRPARTHRDLQAADVVGILDAVDVPTVVVSRDCRVTLFNRAAAETLAFTPADIGRAACDVPAVAGIPEIETICQQAMTDGIAPRRELQNGGRWFLLRAARYPAADTEPEGAVLTFTNITAFRASLGQAIYEREYTKTILNSIADPLVVLDAGLRVQTANRAFYHRFGISREQAQGCPLEDIGDPEWKTSELWGALRSTHAAKQEFPTLELDRNFPDIGRRKILVDARWLVRDEKTLVVVSIRDITEQKKAEEALRQGEAALRENDRRKDEFLATLAHELRNPLAPIRQAAALTRAPAVTDAQKDWSYGVIDRQVHHMALLLDDLLDISRVTRGTLELREQMTDLGTVIAMATETARPIIEARRHALTIEISDSPYSFAADPLRLAQVLSNLLTNAAKYTDPHGEIRLRASCTADTVAFSVADSGIGIPTSKLQEVFAMFSQVRSAQDRSDGGLGIGLALARGLVQLHGGTIEARSDGIGCGSEFAIRLPRKVLHMPSTATAPPAPGKTMRKRILVADDNHDAAQSLAMLLELDGHEVAVVHDGKQALAAWKAFQPGIAILDIGMPEIDGYEVARRIREGASGSTITLIAVTGWGQESDKAKAVSAGFNHHLTKPIEFDALQECLGSQTPQ